MRQGREACAVACQASAVGPADSVQEGITASFVGTEGRGLELIVNTKLGPDQDADDVHYQEAVCPFLEHYAVKVHRRRDASSGSTAQFLVSGPWGGAVRDVAALLEARFAEEQAVGAVLASKDRCGNGLVGEAANDFAADMHSLEAEHGVRVKQGHHAHLVIATSQVAVSEAVATLQEMLQFYLPSEYRLFKELTPPVLQQLQDHLARDSVSNRRGKAVLGVRTGTLWICGAGCQQLAQGVDDMLRDQAQRDSRLARSTPRSRSRSRGRIEHVRAGGVVSEDYLRTATEAFWRDMQLEAGAARAEQSLAREEGIPSPDQESSWEALSGDEAA